MAYRVTVKGRWWWQQDDFYSENEISVEVFASGVMKITPAGGGSWAESYSANAWRSVTSRVVPSKAKV